MKFCCSYRLQSGVHLGALLAYIWVHYWRTFGCIIGVHLGAIVFQWLYGGKTVL
jgi:hypothetical protein